MTFTLIRLAIGGGRLAKSTVRILVVDDFDQWRVRVREIVERQPELEIVAEACDGFQAVRIAAALKPDLIILDIGMPVMNGLDAANHIRRVSPQSKIIFLTQQNDADIQSAALAAGAHGYLSKIEAQSRLLNTIAAAFE